MEISVEKLPKSVVKIQATIQPDEIQADLETAASHISEHTKIQGFRPGKATFDAVKSRVGEMAIWQEAAEIVVRRAYVKAILDNKFEPVGAPAVELNTLAPGNPIVFTATVTVLPSILSMPELASLSIETKAVAVPEKDIDDAVAELQKMQTKETVVERAAETRDKVTMDVDMEKDHVAIEGGQARDHSVFLGEPYYVLGFTDQIVGLKAGDTKKFPLAFPADHFQKQLAGQTIDFSVKVNKVSELHPPAVDEVFAKALGQDSVAGLRDVLKKNLAQEAEAKENERQEIAAIEALITKATFSEFPDSLVDAEADKMVLELEHSITERGMTFPQYLENIKKTKEQVKLDFVPQAIKRVKTTIALRNIARNENLEADEKEIADRIAETMNQYKDNPDAQERIRSEEYENIVRNAVLSKKTIAYILGAIQKKAA